jgi:hypothetical protein
MERRVANEHADAVLQKSLSFSVRIERVLRCPALGDVECLWIIDAAIDLIREIARVELWTPQESQVECREYQDNSDIHGQPFPEPAPEEQDIDTDYDGRHQPDV